MAALCFLQPAHETLSSYHIATIRNPIWTQLRSREGRLQAWTASRSSHRETAARISVSSENRARISIGRFRWLRAPATTFVITRSKHRSDFGTAILTACGAVVFCFGSGEIGSAHV